MFLLQKELLVAPPILFLHRGGHFEFLGKKTLQEEHVIVLVRLVFIDLTLRLLLLDILQRVFSADLFAQTLYLLFEFEAIDSLGNELPIEIRLLRVGFENLFLGNLVLFPRSKYRERVEEVLAHVSVVHFLEVIAQVVAVTRQNELKDVFAASGVEDLLQ